MSIRKFIVEDNENKFPITSVKDVFVNEIAQEMQFVIMPQNKTFCARHCDYFDNIVFEDGEFYIIYGNSYNLFDFCKNFTVSCNGEMKDSKVILAWLKKNYDIDPVAFNKMIETVH